ncbi:MAG: HAMP domain-containing protein [Archangiaceae bacterium]|nr:HAMP domain-containing protein [Archangiaceae bacterium]
MSLRLKLSMAIAVICLFTVGTVVAVRTVTHRHEAEAELQRKAEVYAQLLGRQLEEAVAYDDLTTVREVLESAGSDPDVTEIALYDDDGRLIEGSDPRPEPWGGVPRVVASRWSKEAVVIAAPVASHQGPRAVLYLSLSTERTRHQLLRALWVSCAVSFALMALAIAAGWLFAGVAVRRLQWVATAADRVAAGDLAIEPLAPGAADEVGRLTAGFNVMLNRIRTEQERLAELVEARTTELKASHEQLKQIAETTRAIPFEYDLAHHRFTYVGPQCAQVTGHPASDWLAAGFLDRTMAAGEYALALADVRAQLVRGPQYDTEFRLRAVDGRWVYLRTLATAVDDVGRGMLLDVTERKQLESELQSAQRLESVGRLAAGIAHEINTPVQFSNDSVIFAKEAWVELVGLLDEYRQGRPALEAREQAIDLEYLRENVPRSLDRAVDGLHRIAEIVRSMKAFAQAEQVEMTSYDVREGLSTTLTIAKNEYKYVADVQTRFDEVSPVLARPGELNQVWLSLLTNAAQAITERGGRGTITVACEARADAVVVSIADTGCGIPDGVRGRVFDPFFTTRAVGKGKGQSLAMARAVVQRHGGAISFESKVGEGTTFVVTLPAEGSALERVA